MARRPRIASLPVDATVEADSDEAALPCRFALPVRNSGARMQGRTTLLATFRATALVVEAMAEAFFGGNSFKRK